MIKHASRAMFAAALMLPLAAQAQDKIIKLGTFAPETGPNAAVYQIAQSTDAFLKAANDAGGINGYKFQYSIQDDQYNPALTVSVVRKLVEQDGIFAVVGGIGTGTTIAVKSYLQSQGVPNIAPSTGAPAAAGPLSYLMQPDSTNEGAFEVKYAHDNLLKDNKLTVLYQNDDVGKSYLKGIDYEAKQIKGLQLTAIPFQLNTLDFTPVVARAKQSGAAVVIVSSTPQNFAPIIKVADSLAYTPKWMGVSYDANPAILKQLPASENQNLLFVAWTALPDTPDVQTMNAALAKYYPSVVPSALTIQGWIPGTIFAEAFRRMTNGGKAPSKQALAAALDSFKGYSNDYIRNVTYAPGPGIESPHLPRPLEAIMHWTGSKLELVSKYQEVPKVPGEPGQ